jgi:hypothetical protein
MSPELSARFAPGDIWEPSHEPVNPAYDKWPDGDPPDWQAGRSAVLEHDSFACQAPGCPHTGLALDLHHRRERWQGGSHRLDNLVSLCRVHHAIVHLDTNKLEVRQANCTVVSRHWRRARFTGTRHEVRISIRRLRLVTAPELARIREHFGLRCPCGEAEWEGWLNAGKGLIRTHCPRCGDRWELEPGLVEETGTQLATAFRPSRNAGTFTFDPSLIRGIRQPVCYEGCPECLRQSRRGYLKTKRGVFGSFRGCSEWPNCHYTRPIAKQPRPQQRHR